jgi:hypothetical protein
VNDGSVDKLTSPGDDFGVTSTSFTSEGEGFTVAFAVSVDCLAYSRKSQFLGRKAAE